jgi:DNA-binding response OmpR family regulator
MILKSLVLCSDEKTVRLLRRVLSDLEIAAEHCERPEDAIHKLTRERFEAVIVDCGNDPTSAAVLKAVRSAPCNKRAIAVAIVDAKANLRAIFDLGAHFVLYKPFSAERAKSSFRAARALMKRERRRNFRLPIQIPVLLTGSADHHIQTIDISEGGFSVKLSRKSRESGRLRFAFTLPGADHEIEGVAEVAWESPNHQAGIRFSEISAAALHQLKTWLNSNSLEFEKDDPPVHCRLTDLSLGGCYLETASPFPVRTRIALSMRVRELEFRAQGLIRVMHPEIGMGVEFTQRTGQQRQDVANFIQSLMDGQGGPSDLLVEPEGLDQELELPATKSLSGEVEDPLLELFLNRAELPADVFLGELRKQRRTQSADPAETVFEI